VLNEARDGSLPVCQPAPTATGGLNQGLNQPAASPLSFCCAMHYLCAGALADVGLAAGAAKDGILQLRRLPHPAPSAALHRGRTPCAGGVGGWLGGKRGRVGCEQGRQQAQYCCVPACLPAAARDPPPATRPALTCPCPSPPTLPLACCPSLPLQAPIPELAQLRQGPGWQQHGLRVTSEAAEPLSAPPCAPALDIELTIERWEDSGQAVRGHWGPIPWAVASPGCRAAASLPLCAQSAHRCAPMRTCLCVWLQGQRLCRRPAVPFL
jgi:hypothetical protein